ncbi:Zinc finger protein [Armadillidium vulgare]|nr:Zinc finger protein [Armadillidium vulgare]
MSEHYSKKCFDPFQTHKKPILKGLVKITSHMIGKYGLPEDKLSKLICINCLAKISSQKKTNKNLKLESRSQSRSKTVAGDKVAYFYKPKNSSEVITIDDALVSDLDITLSEDEEEEPSYQDKDKKVSVKKSLIDNYRLKSNYFGPLRIISEKVKVKDKGVLKEAIQAKLQHVEIQATNNQGKPVDEHELKILMSQTPGIIPACDPEEVNRKGNSAFMTLNLGNDDVYKVCKKALTAFQKLANVKPPFNTKIQRVFTSSDGVIVPVTIVSLYPRTDKIVYEAYPEDEKKLPLRKYISKKDKYKPKLVNYYRQNYINWAHRGSIRFSEIKKVGMDFVDDILTENLLVEDTLKLLGCSVSSTAQNLEPVEVNENEVEHSEFPIGSKEFVEDVWNYLTGLVRNDSFLIEFEFEMDEEKWLEIKRAFNMFQVNGEVIPDILLKVVLKKKEDDTYDLTYYLRVIGRLVKYGPVLSKADVNDMLKCLAKDKYICIGFARDIFLDQADQNEMLRIQLKENCTLMMLPFETLHSKRCKAIVRDVDNIENKKIQRGSTVALGPSVVCEMCSSIHTKLKELVDPTLNLIVPQEVAQRYIKQRYGPLSTINISENIKSLFTMTPGEFVSGMKRKLSSLKTCENEDIIVKQLKAIDDEPLDIFESDKPSIQVSEEQFEKMISIRKYSKTSNVLRKECEVCGFQAKSMLALFVHMEDHLGPLTEGCEHCDLKLSSPEALLNHTKVCVHSRKNLKCWECHNIFPSSEKLFEHMNSHRKIKPYKCGSCTSEFQTMNEYKKHIRLIHSITTVKQLNYHCHFCHSYFYTNDHLLIHKINQNHCEKEHIGCKICNFSAGLVDAFKSHLMTHSYEQRENHNMAICLSCQKIFFSSYRLEDHHKKMHPTTQVSVSKEKSVVSPPTTQTQAGDVAEYVETISCPKCFKVYSSEASLQRHIENYHSDKNYPSSQPSPLTTVSCDVCGRKFNSEYFLNAHMKLHTASRPVFQCEECGFK